MKLITLIAIALYCAGCNKAIGASKHSNPAVIVQPEPTSSAQNHETISNEACRLRCIQNKPEHCEDISQ